MFLIDNPVTTIPPDGPFLQFAKANASEFTGTMRLVSGSQRLEITWNSGYPGQARYFENDSRKVEPPADAPAPWPLLLAFKMDRGQCSLHPGKPVGFPGFPTWELMRKGLIFSLGRNNIIDRANGRRAFEISRAESESSLILNRIPAAEKLLLKLSPPLSVNQLLNKTEDPFTLAVDLELLSRLGLIGFDTEGAAAQSTNGKKPADHILVLGRHLVTQRRWREAMTCLFRYRSPSKEAAALLAWSRFMEAPDNQEFKSAAKISLENAIREKPGRVQYYSYLAAIHRLDGNYAEAEKVLTAAKEHSPNDESVMRELTFLRLRSPRKHDFTPVKVRDYRAEIAIQRWIGGHSIVHTMRKPSCTLGSSRQDDIILSANVLHRIIPNHCSITKHEGRYFLVRNRESGSVFINGLALPVKQPVELHYTDVISLGARPPAGDIEFRLLELQSPSPKDVLADPFKAEELNHAFELLQK